MISKFFLLAAGCCCCDIELKSGQNDDGGGKEAKLKWAQKKIKNSYRSRV